MRTLERPGLERVNAGIALQAYLPDSFSTQKRLGDWARYRLAAGGAPITLRIVKGANLEMERVEASLRGWPQAPFRRKLETDANYKRMMQEAMKPENLAAVRIGLASHNLFDLAYGLVLAMETNAFDKVQFEMLEGMANPQRRALFELTGNLLLYAPVCRKEEFIHAIGYLIRRLDENTGPDNFLRHAFKIHVGSPEWLRLEEGFVRSFDAIATLPEAPRRTQNRLRPAEPPARCGADWTKFVNEPDTDFSLPHHAEWAKQIVAKWKPKCGQNATDIPLVVAGEEVGEGFAARTSQPQGSLSPSEVGSGRRGNRNRPPAQSTKRTVRECLDPSRPGVIVGRCLQASAEDVERAVACAVADEDGWRALSAAQRYDKLGEVARELRRARADLIGAALANAGKTIAESDPEVSEAVDFVEFYSASARYF